MSFSEWIILRTGGETWQNLLLFYTNYISDDLAHHEIFPAKVILVRPDDISSRTLAFRTLNNG